MTDTYEEYTFDENGNEITKRARDARIITATFDKLNRVTLRHVPGASANDIYDANKYEFVYDLVGRTLTSYHYNYNSDYTYDAAGRPLTKTEYNINSTSAYKDVTIGYQYDDAGNVTRLTHPDGFQADFTYDALNRVSAAKHGTRTLASVAYDPLSRRQSVTYDNGTSSSFDYTARGDLTDLDWNLTGTANDLAYDFTYNGVGQLLTDTVNKASMQWTPPTIMSDNYTANNLNQYSSVNGVSPIYDGNGNVTTDLQGRTHMYSAANELIRTWTNGGASWVTNVFRADGTRRLHLRQGAGGGGHARFYQDGDQDIMESDWTGGGLEPGLANTLRRYIRLPGSVDEVVLMIDYTLNSGCTDATSTSYAACERWAHQDRLGSVVSVSDSAGAMVEEYRYSPYGVSGTEGTSGFPFRFTGQRLDASTGLYYYKARFYDPEIGRFLQTDPIGYEDQMNMYAYVGNDPVNATDPTGEDTITCVTNSDGEPTSCLREEDDFSDTFILIHKGKPKELKGRPGSTQGTDDQVADAVESLYQDHFGLALEAEIYTPRQLENAIEASINQMNVAIRRGQAPAGVRRVDRGTVRGEQDHVHLRDGRALNRDGTWKHNNNTGPNRNSLTRAQKDWLQENGWRTPPDS